MISSKTRLTRRDFLHESLVGAVSSVAAFSVIPRHVLGASDLVAPNDKLNIVCIGVGGRGYHVARNVSSENIVALCDVDDNRAAKTYDQFPKAKKYHDYRIMLDKEEKQIDAVVVACTDHVHLPASVKAMKMGKHVYCEKPLGQNINEVRIATKVANECGVATQMGSGAHSGYNYYRVAAMIKSGVIGDVKEVHCWCDESWPPGDRPKHQPPVPEYLKWDLWLGPAPVRPYHPTYHPLGWRHWWDFGNGRIGDMGCHMIDLPYTALDLKYPLTVEADGPTLNKESAPRWLIVKWTFPKRGNKPPVELTWYDGIKRPPIQKQYNMPDWPEGTIFVGSKGMLIAQYGEFKLFPEKDFVDYKPPHFPFKQHSHADNWIIACKSDHLPGCQFDYSGPLTETILLGTVAYRAGQKLEWDAQNQKVTNCPEANQFISRINRKGWEL